MPCPLPSPDTRMCHRDVPRDLHPWEEATVGPFEGQEGALPLPMTRASLGPRLQDAEMLWQSPWQPRYTARANKADRRETEEKGKGVRKKKKEGKGNSLKSWSKGCGRRERQGGKARVLWQRKRAAFRLLTLG